MRKFYDTEKIVKKILEDLPIMRSNDNLLYVRYWQLTAPDVNFIDFFMKPSKYNGATFKHVERCRRKLQSKYSELQSAKAMELRYEEETKFKKYGLGWHV